MYDRLLRKNIRIRSVWIADIWNQGQSGVLNEKMLGNDRSYKPTKLEPPVRNVLSTFRLTLFQRLGSTTQET